jgi:uncharacterized protein
MPARARYCACVSQENVDNVRRGFEAMNRGDIEGTLEMMDPSIEWHPTEDFVEAGPFRGHAGVRQLLGFLLNAFDSYAIEPQEFIEAGDKVIVPVHQSGRGKGSGAKVDVRYIVVFTLRDGKGVRVDSYYDREEALKSAGLSE